MEINRSLIVGFDIEKDETLRKGLEDFNAEIASDIKGAGLENIGTGSRDYTHGHAPNTIVVRAQIELRRQDITSVTINALNAAGWKEAKAYTDGRLSRGFSKTRVLWGKKENQQ